VQDNDNSDEGEDANNALMETKGFSTNVKDFAGVAIEVL